VAQHVDRLVCERPLASTPTASGARQPSKGTEAAWALEPERRRAGEEIVAALRERGAAAASLVRRARSYFRDAPATW
jgi:hypothetical protein